MRNEDLYRSEPLAHFAKSCGNLFCIRNVRRDCQCILAKFSGKCVDELGRASEHCDTATFLDELAHERCSESGSISVNNRHALSPILGHTSPLLHASGS